MSQVATKKAKELQIIMRSYRADVKALEQELTQAVSEYSEALRQAKIKILQKSLGISHE